MSGYVSGYDKSKVVGTSEKDLIEFTCGICRDLLRDPLVTQCCRQAYCRECIEEWLSLQHNCPNDGKSLRARDLIPAPRFAVNFLDGLLIKCDYKEKGCPVITTIGDLHKHLENCVYNPHINCKTCGLRKDNKEDHNCYKDLVLENKSITNTMNRLFKENQELKNKVKNITMDISVVLGSVRKSINDFKTREHNINYSQYRFLIQNCQDAIMRYNNLLDICKTLSRKIENSLPNRGPKYWQVYVYAPEGGESTLYYDNYFSIEYEKLIVEFFTAKG